MKRVISKLNLKSALKALTAIILLSWFFYKSNVSMIFKNIAGLPLKFFLAAFVLALIYLLIRSSRWRLLLPQYPAVKLIKLSFISQFYSTVSVGQFAGEASKIYILGKGKSEAGLIAMSVFIDKITGLTGLIIVAFLGLFFTPTVLPKSLSLSFTAAAALCLILIFSAKLSFICGPPLKLLTSRLDKSIKLKKIFGGIISLLKAWRFYSKKIKPIFNSIVLSVFLQLVLVGVYLTLSYGVGIHLYFFDWCWVIGVLSALLVLPITVGGLGIREGSLVGLLGFFAVERERALALSFSVFGIQLILAAIGGIMEARRTNLFRIKEPS